MHTRVWTALAVALQVGLGASAQEERQPGRSKIETAHLTLTVAGSDRASPGSRVSLAIDVAPKPGMHVYAPEQKDMIPITLTLSPDAAFKAHKPRLPRPEKYYFEPLQETQFVYSRRFRIVQDVTVADTPELRKRAATVNATLEISGTLRYQACDDKLCYRPQEVPVVWSVGMR